MLTEETTNNSTSVSPSTKEPVAKKSRTTTASTSTESDKSPYAILQQALKDKCKELGCGYMVVEGVSFPKRYHDVTEDKQKVMEAALTQAKVDKLRIIFMPQDRADAHEKMNKLILGDQADDSVMMFSTRFSYEILEAFEEFKSIYNKSKSPKDRLNYLLGFTNCLETYDVWMHDHECGWATEFGGGNMISNLATMWKTLLKKHSADELGLDEQFSYPGIKAFLKSFKKTVESVDMYDEPSLKFKYA